MGKREKHTTAIPDAGDGDYQIDVNQSDKLVWYRWHGESRKRIRCSKRNICKKEYIAVENIHLHNTEYHGLCCFRGVLLDDIARMNIPVKVASESCFLDDHL
jgi:hypothetical protein